MTDIRPELSSKNKYWIERHRYYELKHFCLQYPMWKAIIMEIDGVKSPKFSGVIFSQNVSNPTEWAVEKREEFCDKAKLVEDTALRTSPELHSYIFKAVTEGRSYENLRYALEMPASKEHYYDLYRRFFYILDKTRK